MALTKNERLARVAIILIAKSLADSYRDHPDSISFEESLEQLNLSLLNFISSFDSLKGKRARMSAAADLGAQVTRIMIDLILSSDAKNT